jgi:hypothetical protein
VELGLLVLALGDVAGGPGRGAREISSSPDWRAAVDDQLLEGLGSRGRRGSALVLRLARAVGVRGSLAKIGREGAGLGVVALVEEFVGLAVDVGVHQDRGRGRAVAAGAADLLIIALEAAGQRGVDDRAHIGLVDAHAERGGRDDDLALAGEEGGLDAVAVVAVMPAW